MLVSVFFAPHDLVRFSICGAEFCLGVENKKPQHVFMAPRMGGGRRAIGFSSQPQRVHRREKRTLNAHVEDSVFVYAFVFRYEFVFVSVYGFRLCVCVSVCVCVCVCGSVCL